MRIVIRLFGIAYFVAFCSVACAQVWPARTIRVIVNAPAGGGSDVYARIYAGRLADALGQPVIVENQAGGSGNIGVENVVRAAPDGYTLLHSPGGNIVVTPHLYKLNFDPLRDLAPIAPVARSTVLLVVRADLPVNSVGDLIAYARSHPGELNFGSAGSGTLPHITGELFARTAKIKATHIPYKGVAPALTALLGSQIDYTFDSGISIPYIKAGKLRLLAVAGSERSLFFPDAPTMAEAGTPVDASTVQGVYAPSATAREIVARLHREIMRIMQSPEAIKALAAIGAKPAVAASPEQFADELRDDSRRFEEIVRIANIKPD